MANYLYNGVELPELPEWDRETYPREVVLVRMTAYILNLLDLAFTLHALSHGATECNPLMRCVPIMVAYKVLAVGGLCWWLSHRTEPVARRCMGPSPCGTQSILHKRRMTYGL